MVKFALKFAQHQCITQFFQRIFPLYVHMHRCATHVFHVLASCIVNHRKLLRFLRRCNRRGRDTVLIPDGENILLNEETLQDL